MKRELFKTIVSDLLSDDFFADFKFIRSENLLISRNDKGFVAVELQHWRDYWEDNCVIRPLYEIHFNVLSQWFEKYCQRPLKYQRLSPHLLFCYDDFGQEPMIEIKYDFSDYEIKYKELSSAIKARLASTIRSYQTVDDFYRKNVLPRMMGDMEFPGESADWMFWYLTAGFLVDKENYPILRKKIEEQADWLVHHRELNVAKYYDRMDEIISYMENNVES